MEPIVVERFVKAQAPVNIAVIKYWGKSDEELKVPINDSLSGTLSMDDMCTTTSVCLSSNFQEDKLVLNGVPQDLSETSPATKMISTIRSLAVADPAQSHLLNTKAQIVSENNFPTAAGLASSAAGYACLAWALGHAYGIKDPTILSRIARNGSGSACRSLFGGFVHWVRGTDHDSSVAQQVVDHLHWPDMRVVICVVNDKEKDVSSSLGMLQSVKTSPLIGFRAEHVVPQRINDIKQAILKQDFETFANITMRDSNEFHAICLDTHPPIFYLNETSRHIIRLCHLVNDFYGKSKLCYTFDAGPNACIYLLNEFVPIFIEIVNHFWPKETNDGDSSSLTSYLDIRGRPHEKLQQHDVELVPILEFLECKNVKQVPNAIKYLINTSIGDGPKLIEERSN